VKLGSRSSLVDIAFQVGEALRRNGVEAVLSGGGCAHFYTRGAYRSADLDFILTGPASHDAVEAAMTSVGFAREGDRYVHPEVRFYVEFPRGPLAIGGDWRIRPKAHARAGARLLSLSPTDCCRDRLAAFYHWKDRQSLRVAVAVAARHRVEVGVIRRWSEQESHVNEFEEFRRELAKTRAALRSRRKG
jgi:hypothetical protein